MSFKKLLVIAAIFFLSACGNKESVTQKTYQEVKKQKVSEGWVVVPQRDESFNNFGNPDAQFCDRKEIPSKIDTFECQVEFTNPQFPNKQLIVKYGVCKNIADCTPKVAISGPYEFKEEYQISSQEANAQFQKKLADSGEGYGPGAEAPKNVASPASEKYKEGIEYTYYSDGSCKPSDKKVCLSFDDYKQICSVAKGVTEFAIKMRGVNASSDEKILLEGGSYENIQVLWAKSGGGKEQCYAVITASGLINGNSARKQIEGVASTFIKNSSGKVLVSYFSLY